MKNFLSQIRRFIFPCLFGVQTFLTLLVIVFIHRFDFNTYKKNIDQKLTSTVQLIPKTIHDSVSLSISSLSDFYLTNSPSVTPSVTPSVSSSVSSTNTIYQYITGHYFCIQNRFGFTHQGNFYFVGDSFRGYRINCIFQDCFFAGDTCWIFRPEEVTPTTVKEVSNDIGIDRN